MKSSAAHELGYRDLTKDYPLALRYIFRESIWWCVGLSVILLLLFIGVSSSAFIDTVMDPEVFRIVQQKKAVIALGVGAVLIVKLFYSFLIRATYRYCLEGKRLRISRGLLFREEASLPLLPLTELYIRYNLWDMIFGLRNLYIALPAERVAKIAELRGLSTRTAVELQRYLTRVIASVSENPNSDISIRVASAVAS